MREIKFRAWDVKHGAWIMGFNLVSFHDYYTKGLKPSLQRYDSKWEEGEYILMQYTGLKDENGKEIYEGDLFQASRHCYEVKYRGGEYILAYLKDDGPYSHAEFAYTLSYALFNVRGEIVGNIYEERHKC